MLSFAKWRPRNTIVKVFPLIFLCAAATATDIIHAQEAPHIQVEPFVDARGAIRLNYGWLDYSPTSRLQLELLRADVKAGAGLLFFSAQYSWHDRFGAAHHAYTGNASAFISYTNIRAACLTVSCGLDCRQEHVVWRPLPLT